jgi:hypothetical protein
MIIIHPIGQPDLQQSDPASLDSRLLKEAKHKGVFTCYFCDKHAPDAEGKLTKTIYKVTARTYVPRRVQYKYTDIDLPRCKHCKKLHAKGRRIFWVVFFLALMTGLGLVVSGNGALMICSFIFIFASNWIALSVERGWARKTGTKPLQNSVLACHPLMANLVKDKWQFVKPRA